MSGGPGYSDYMQARFKWSPTRVYVVTSGSVFLFLLILSMLFALGAFVFTGGVLPASLGFLLFLKPVMMPLVLGLGTNGAIVLFSILLLLVASVVAIGSYILARNVKQFKPENIKPAVAKPVDLPKPARQIEVELEAQRAAEKAQEAAEKRQKLEAEEKAKIEEQAAKAKEQAQKEKAQVEHAEKARAQQLEQEAQRAAAEKVARERELEAQKAKEQEEKEQKEPVEPPKKEELKEKEAQQQREAEEAKLANKVAREQAEKQPEPGAEKLKEDKSEDEKQEQQQEEEVVSPHLGPSDYFPPPEQEKNLEGQVEGGVEEIHQPGPQEEPVKLQQKAHPKLEEDKKDEPEERGPIGLQDPKHGELALAHSARWVDIGYQLLARLNGAKQKDLDSKGFEKGKEAELSLPAWLQLERGSQFSEALNNINKQFLFGSPQSQGTDSDKYIKTRQLYLTAIICMSWAIYAQAVKEGSIFDRGAYTLQGEKLHACLRDYVAFATHDSKPEEVAPPWTAVLSWKTSEFAYMRNLIAAGMFPLSSHEVDQQFGIDLRFFGGELASGFLPYQHSHILFGTKQGASYLKFEPEGIATREAYDHLMHFKDSGKTSGADRREKDRPEPLSTIYKRFLKNLGRPVPKKLPPVFVMYAAVCARPHGQEHAIFIKAQADFEEAAELLGYREGLETRIGNECQLDLRSFWAIKAPEQESYGIIGSALGSSLSSSVIIERHGDGDILLNLMDNYVPGTDHKIQEEEILEEDDIQEGLGLGDSSVNPIASALSGSKKPSPVKQELPSMVNGRYTHTALAFIARHKTKMAGGQLIEAIKDEHSRQRIASVYDKNGKKIALFEPVIDSLKEKSEKGMYALSFALKKYQEYIAQQPDHTCEELIIPLAKNGQVLHTDTYQHWVFLHVKYNAQTGEYEASLHDSKSYYGPGWFYKNDTIESAVENAFGEGKVAFEAHYHGNQGLFNNEDCGPFVAEYIQRVLDGKEIPRDLIIEEEHRHNHGVSVQKQQREEYANSAYPNLKQECIRGLIGGDPLKSIDAFRVSCERLIEDDADSQVAVLFYAESTIIDEVFGRDEVEVNETQEKRFKKLMYRLGSGLLHLKDMDILEDADKKEEYKAKKAPLIFIVELMQALSTVVQDGNLKGLPYDALLEAIKTDDISKAVKIMDKSFLHSTFFSYVNQEMKKIKKQDIGKLLDKYPGLVEKRQDTEGWGKAQKVIEAWEATAAREERVLDLMKGEKGQAMVFAFAAHSNFPQPS